MTRLLALALLVLALIAAALIRATRRAQDWLPVTPELDAPEWQW